MRALLTALGAPTLCAEECAGECARALRSAEVLDVRAGRERWELNGLEPAPTVTEPLHAVVEDLGLLTGTAPRSRRVDAVVVPGAAGTTARVRVEYATRLADELGATDTVVLSGDRALTGHERERVATWAPRATDEHELMQAAVDLHARGSTRPVTSLRAATRRGARPSTEDTARLLFERFAAPHHERYLVVTTSLFVPYQHLVFLRTAAPRPIVVETVGVPAAHTGSRTDDMGLLEAVSGLVREASGLLAAEG